MFVCSGWDWMGCWNLCMSLTVPEKMIKKLNAFLWKLQFDWILFCTTTGYFLPFSSFIFFEEGREWSSKTGLFTLYFQIVIQSTKLKLVPPKRRNNVWCSFELIIFQILRAQNIRLFSIAHHLVITLLTLW